MELTTQFLITIRFTSECPTIRITLDECDTTQQNIETIKATFDQRTDLRHIIIKRRITQTTIVENYQ